MSRFLKIFIPGIISLVFSFALIAEDLGVFDPSPEYIRLLISQLGSANFADRENASKELIRLGYNARSEVEKALDSKDPEVKIRLKGIWNKIQWSIFPGADEDVNKFLSKLESVGIRNSDQWNDIIKKYGPEIMPLFIRLQKRPGFSIHVRNGMLSLLGNSNPQEIATYIQKSPDKAILTKMFISLNENRLKPLDSQKLQHLLRSLGLKEESMMTAAASWKMSNSSEIPDEIILLFNDKDFTEKVFFLAREQLNGTESSLTNDWKICFFAKISKDIKRKDLIKSLLDELDYNIRDNSSILYLSEILISMSLFKEAIDVLSGTHTLNSIYLRAVAYHNSGDENTGTKFMELLYSKLKNERDCYAISMEMNKFKDPRAVKLWEDILQIPPYGSIYDANATGRLAAYYEEKGDYGKAADLLEKGLVNNDQSIWEGDENSAEFGKAVKESLKTRIANLKEQEKGGAEIWFNAANALKKKENEKALEGFRKFLENNPQYPWTYYNITIILESQKKFDKAISCIDKGINLLNKDNSNFKIEFLLKKIFLLSMHKKYGQAITELEKVVDLDPENSDIFSMLAMNTYYTKDYQKSAELFARNYAMNPEDLYTQLWIYISLSKIDKNPNPEFANFAKNLQGDGWPVPIIKYYAGLITLEKCLEATFDLDKNRENEKKCEAYYFIGELFLLNKKKKEAIEYFNKCIKCDIADFREHISSLQRLEELK